MSDKCTLFFAVLACMFCFNANVEAQHRQIFKTIYTRQACVILKDRETGKIASSVEKGTPLMVFQPVIADYKENFTAGLRRVRCQDGTLGYVDTCYVCETEQEALARYKPEQYDHLHKAIKNPFNGGLAFGCDFYPRTKPAVTNKKMPRACYSLYLTANMSILNNIDSYIALAKSTKINTFVIDVKEDGLPGFKADAMKEYCPSAYARAGAENERIYKTAVRKLHDAGFWVAGRIVVFKDYHITKDHPECGLWNKAENCLLYHNKSNWPSAYSRLIWEYNVSLAVEAVEKIGFDEINFDYVRFPDKMMRIEGSIEMRNKYHESKVQAIQRFVTYAADQLHRHNAFLSIDVFGESANPGYTTAYGQYWPAISNVADVICGMPYPDHFSDGYYGIAKPWNHPYEIMHAWGERVMERQKATPSPAIVRTWVQAYHVMKHVDRNGIDYNAENIEKEIRGLYSAGLTGGYCTWLSNASLERYRMQAGAFRIDYYSEYCKIDPCR